MVLTTLIFVAVIAVIALVAYFYNEMKAELKEIKTEYFNALSDINERLCDIRNAVVRNRKLINDSLHELKDQHLFLTEKLAEVDKKIADGSKSLNEYLMKTFEDNKKHFDAEFSTLVEEFELYKTTLAKVDTYFTLRSDEFKRERQKNQALEELMFARYFQVKKLVDDGKKISEIAKLMSEEWGYKVSSNDVNELIRIAGNELTARMGIGEQDMATEVNEPIRPEEKEYNVDTIADVNGVKYEVEECNSVGDESICDQCHMDHAFCNQVRCQAMLRTDGKNVVFKLHDPEIQGNKESENPCECEQEETQCTCNKEEDCLKGETCEQCDCCEPMVSEDGE